MKEKLKIITVAVIAIALVLVCLWSNAPHTDLPPLVFIDGIMYKDTGTQALQEDLAQKVYLGEIQSSVPSHKKPEKNFQTNYDIYVGAPVYQVGEKLIVYREFEKGSWWEFEKIK